MPRALQQESDEIDAMELDDDDAMDGAEKPVVVVCSGDLVEQVCSSSCLLKFGTYRATGCAPVQFK